MLEICLELTTASKFELKKNIKSTVTESDKNTMVEWDKEVQVLIFLSLNSVNSKFDQTWIKIQLIEFEKFKCL